MQLRQITSHAANSCLVERATTAVRGTVGGAILAGETPGQHLHPCQRCRWRTVYLRRVRLEPPRRALERRALSARPKPLAEEHARARRARHVPPARALLHRPSPSAVCTSRRPPGALRSAAARCAIVRVPPPCCEASPASVGERRRTESPIFPHGAPRASASSRGPPPAAAGAARQATAQRLRPRGAPVCGGGGAARARAAGARCWAGAADVKCGQPAFASDFHGSVFMGKKKRMSLCAERAPPGATRWPPTGVSSSARQASEVARGRVGGGGCWPGVCSHERELRGCAGRRG